MSRVSDGTARSTMAILGLAVCLAAGGCGAGSAEPQAGTSSTLPPSPATAPGPRVVIYDGPAACSDCAAAAATWLARELPDATIKFAGPDGTTDVDAATLAEAALYLQPGGGDDVVGVIGTHPEAPTSWYTEAGVATDGRAGNQDVGDDLLHRLMTRPTSR